MLKPRSHSEMSNVEDSPKIGRTGKAVIQILLIRKTTATSHQKMSWLMHAPCAALGSNQNRPIGWHWKMATKMKTTVITTITAMVMVMMVRMCWKTWRYRKRIDSFTNAAEVM